MDSLVINKLTQLNRDFYQQVAQPFSDSRQQAWEGWQQLADQGFFEIWQNRPIRVLDVGCGNGRFGLFLSSVLKRENIEYWGVDQNACLLEKAETALKAAEVPHVLSVADVISDSKFLESLPEQSFDLIVLFGVLHHVPSSQLRSQLFSRIQTLLTLTGKYVFATWRFLDNQKLKTKIVEPILVGLSANDLEKNDFIIDWQRQTSAYRYCHYYTETEVTKLLQETHLKLKSSFLADGRDHQTNQYFITLIN